MLTVAKSFAILEGSTQSRHIWAKAPKKQTIQFFHEDTVGDCQEEKC